MSPVELFEISGLALSALSVAVLPRSMLEKASGLFFMPLLIAGAYILLTFLGCISP